ncbi:MAG: transglycosylase SLT domain-containing protein [Rickettsiales bacterium]|nr:transglycosylase SLT domain-containing protein [Pseudomonadota bacterium]MDA0965550.1 transglycosylase SLT domain-containing protein [Pseudomonadota bacterium]MDG4542874.1 transglycosylase SLT domain-containing protein [Rickettsiales bacterium]MDG4544678.1 transglycosylase SLT domain-containing protein [Rickettsiales bacterium]MDG4546800.1 transglycosylase SLT domain-containing protein [Rickettsiales bacterium]
MFKNIPLAAAIAILTYTTNISNVKSEDMSYTQRQDYRFERQNSSLCNRYFPIYEHKNHMPSNMLRAISVTESGKWSKFYHKKVAWPWTINVEGKGYYFDSKREAIAKVKKLIAKGKESIDIGCMQINLKYHPDAFTNLNQAFEPRYNIEYAAKFLTEKYEKNGNWETAIRHYHNMNREYSDKYIERIYESWRTEDKGVNLANLNKRPMYIKVTPMVKNNDPEVADITQSVLDNFVR